MIIYSISWERGSGADGHLQSLSQTFSPNPHKGYEEGRSKYSGIIFGGTGVSPVLTPEEKMPLYEGGCGGKTRPENYK